jgi:imidazolonepropionase-like amidohydrolase
VAVGNAADLVLLQSDPLTDIRSTSHIVAVIVRGRLYSRKELDMILHKVAITAARSEPGS